MSALKLRSSVLIVQHPHPSDVAFGADFAVDFASAAQQIREYAYQVVVLPSDPAAGQTALTFLDELNAIAPLTQRVVIQNQTTPEDLRRVVNKGNVFKILANYQDPQFEQTIMEALEEYNLIRQNTKLLSLVNEQNESLRRLNTET